MCCFGNFGGKNGKKWEFRSGIVVRDGFLLFFSMENWGKGEKLGLWDCGNGGKNGNFLGFGQEMAEFIPDFAGILGMLGSGNAVGGKCDIPGVWEWELTWEFLGILERNGGFVPDFGGDFSWHWGLGAFPRDVGTTACGRLAMGNKVGIPWDWVRNAGISAQFCWDFRDFLALGVWEKQESGNVGTASPWNGVPG